MSFLGEYWTIEDMGAGSYKVEAEGMASAIVSVYSHDAQEMLLAHLAEEICQMHTGETLQ